MRDLLHLVDTSRQKSRSSLKDMPSKLTRQGVHQAILEYRFQITEGLLTDDYQRLVAIAGVPPKPNSSTNTPSASSPDGGCYSTGIGRTAGSTSTHC